MTARFTSAFFPAPIPPNDCIQQKRLREFDFAIAQVLVALHIQASKLHCTLFLTGRLIQLAWKKDVAPNLSPATVRQRDSYIRIHVLPVFAKEAPHALDVRALQRFATNLQNDLSPKTVKNILEAIFAVMRYTNKCGIKTTPVSFSDLTIVDEEAPEPPYFTSEQVHQIIKAARQPYKTMFALPSVMGARAGELLALTVPDLDFHRRTIRVNKSAADLTRQVRKPKTKKCVALLPMPSYLEPMLRNYLRRYWKNKGSTPLSGAAEERICHVAK
jgi:integrase